MCITHKGYTKSFYKQAVEEWVKDTMVDLTEQEEQATNEDAHLLSHREKTRGRPQEILLQSLGFPIQNAQLS